MVVSVVQNLYQTDTYKYRLKPMEIKSYFSGPFDQLVLIGEQQFYGQQFHGNRVSLKHVYPKHVSVVMSTQHFSAAKCGVSNLTRV